MDKQEINTKPSVTWQSKHHPVHTAFRTVPLEGPQPHSGLEKAKSATQQLGHSVETPGSGVKTKVRHQDYS